MPCGSCGGSGTCPVCDGSGEMTQIKYKKEVKTKCISCSGNGKCRVCGGSGKDASYKDEESTSSD
mgnify:CR=1 FL=1